MKDQGTFYGKGVKTQFKTFLKADDHILNAFIQFGTSLEIPENLIMQIERFVCLLYSKNTQKTIKGYWTHYNFLTFNFIIFICLFIFLTT